MYSIYIFQHKQNQKIYVGKTANFSVRLSKHKSDAKLCPKTYFHKALAKYSIDAFNYFIIEEWESETDCLEAEIFWIAFFRSNYKSNGYNLTDGGEGTSGHRWTLTLENRQNMSDAKKGKIHSSERRLTNSLVRRGSKNQNYGKPMSENQKIKISNSRKGKLCGAENTQTKINQQIADLIREDYLVFKSSRQLAIKYNLSPSTILNIINNKVWIKIDS